MVAVLHDALPRAGRTGTLAGRFRGTAAEDNVRAKTGTIIGGAALTGTGTTAAGRAFVFCVIVNGARRRVQRRRDRRGRWLPSPPMPSDRSAR